ncbi:MAG: glycosyltransferase family 2 protein [Deltaproteobacteria bacterium]|nr:glycosyltransferase family 2 protein [Deltaproteobacteria bacterium]
MSAPLVSVIIPVYNGAAFLARAVESVLAQTLDDLEVIVVDDGSQDASGDVAARLAAAHASVRLLRQVNQGPGAARNAGAAVAQGRFVAYCDADDLWLPGKLSRQMPLFEDPAVALVYSGLYHQAQTQRTDITPRKRFCRGRCFLPLLTYNCIPCSTVVLRREVLAQTGGFPPERRFIGVEDKVLWLKVTRHQVIDYVAEPLVAYNVEPNRLSTNVARMLAADLAVLDEVARFNPPLSPAEQDALDRARPEIERHHGDSFFQLGEMAAARRCFGRYLAQGGRDLRTAGLFLLSCLPGPLVEALRRTKRALAG